MSDPKRKPRWTFDDEEESTPTSTVVVTTTAAAPRWKFDDEEADVSAPRSGSDGPGTLSLETKAKAVDTSPSEAGPTLRSLAESENDSRPWYERLAQAGRELVVGAAPEERARQSAAFVNSDRGKDLTRWSQSADVQDTLKRHEGEAKAWVDHVTRLGEDPEYAASKFVSGILPGGQVPVPLPGGQVAATALKQTSGELAKAALARVGRSMLEGGLSAGYSRALEAYGDDPEHSVVPALKEGGEAGLWGAGLSGLLSARSETSKAASDWLNKRADLNRVASTGNYGSDLRNLRDNIGDENVSKLAKDIERLGLHENQSEFWPVRMLSKLIPASAGRYADNAQALLNKSGKGLRADEAAINALPSPPTVNINKFIDPMEQRVSELGRRIDPAAAGSSASRGGELPRLGGEAGFRQQMVDNAKATSNAVEIPGKPTQYVKDWGEALADRRYIDDNINWNRKGGYEGAGMQEQVRREAAGNLRASTKDALKRGVENGTVPPKLADSWNTNNDNYRVAAAVRDPAIGRVYKEFGNQQISLPAWATGDPFAGTLAQLAKTYGRSTMAGTQRALANVAEPGVVNALATDSSFAPAAIATGLTRDPSQNAAAIAALARGNPTLRTQQPEQQNPGTSDAYAQAELNSGSRGHLLEQNLQRLLETNPGAFGPYAQEFAGKEPGQLSATAERLAQRDPNFQRFILPLLNGASR